MVGRRVGLDLGRPEAARYYAGLGWWPTFSGGACSVRRCIPTAAQAVAAACARLPTPSLCVDVLEVLLDGAWRDRPCGAVCGGDGRGLPVAASRPGVRSARGC